MSLSNTEKGSIVGKKRLTGDLSYIEIEQSKEQKTALEPDLPDGGPSASARGGVPQAVFVPQSSFGCRQWEVFAERMFGAWIDRILPAAWENSASGYWLPDRFPPTNKDDWPAWQHWLIQEGWTVFETSEQEVRHAS